MNLLLNQQIKAAKQDMALIPGENFRQIITWLESSIEQEQNPLARVWLENLKQYEPQAISGVAEQYLSQEESELICT